MTLPDSSKTRPILDLRKKILEDHNWYVYVINLEEIFKMEV